MSETTRNSGFKKNIEKFLLHIVFNCDNKFAPRPADSCPSFVLTSLILKFEDSFCSWDSVSHRFLVERGQFRQENIVSFVLKCSLKLISGEGHNLFVTLNTTASHLGIYRLCFINFSLKYVKVISINNIKDCHAYPKKHKLFKIMLWP